MKKTNFTKIMTLCLMVMGLFSATSVMAQCPAGQTQVTVTVDDTAGAFNTEHGWELVDATTNTVLACVSSAAGIPDGVISTTDVCVIDGNDLELRTFDDFGDTWNGATISVASNESGAANGCNAQAIELIAPFTPGAPPAAEPNAVCNVGGAPTASSNTFALGSVACILCEIIVPADVVTPSDAGICSANVTLAPATLSANCDPADVIVNDFNGGGADASDVFPVGTTTIVFSTAGGTVTDTLTVTVLDAEGPVLDCPGNETRGLNGGECNSAYFFEATATDNCPQAPITVNGPCPPVATGGGSALACGAGPNSIIQIIDGTTPGDFLSQVCFEQETFGTTTTVTVNAYCYDGVNIPFDGGGFTPFASEVFALTTGDNGTVVCLDFATSVALPAGCTSIAVEFVNAFGRSVNTPATCDGAAATGMNTFIVGPACGIATPTLTSGIGFALDASFNASFIPSTFNAIPSPTAPAGVNEFVSGDLLPIGTHCFQYEATDAAGNVSSCDWCVTIEEFPNAVTTLSCNSNLNHGVNATDCEFFVTPDIILEGGPYGCYENYIVTIAGVPANAVVGNGTNSVLIKASQLPGFPENGMAGPYDIMVTDPATGVSCWGSGHMFEDKVAPTITCDTVTIACLTSTAPGGLTTSGVASGSNTEALSWADGDTGEIGSLSFEVSGVPAGGVIDDIAVAVNLDHSWMGDVTITLTNPAGVSADLYDRNCGNVDNMAAIFSDNAANGIACSASATAGPHEDCPGDFATSAGIVNDVQPNDPIAPLMATSPNGTWTVTFTDGVGGDGGCLDVGGVTVNASWNLFGTGTPTVFENCGAFDLDFSDNELGGSCSTMFANVIERTWTVTDAKGNSDQCVQVINVTRASLADVVFPQNLDNLELPALSCVNANIDPSNTGMPTGDECENIGFTFSDSDPIPLCGGNSGSFKILRTWTALDWCTGEIITDPQIIKVIDEVAPVLTCPANMNVSTSNNSCEATVIISGSSIIATDNCSSDVDVSLSISTGTIVQNGPNFIAQGLPIGTYTVTVTAEDACGNDDTCDFTITVTDQTAPTAICETFHTVALSSGNITQVAAGVFDDGSYDNCGPVTMDVRRMTSCIDFDWTTNGAGIDESPNGQVNNADRGTGNPNSQTTGWYPAVPFACCDAGTEIMVAFRVTDEAGNRNTCMVTIEVQDKIDGVIECPDNQDLECSIDILSISDIPLAGVSATDNGGLPTYYSDGTSAYTFVGYYTDAFDNCEANVFILDRGGINSCGESFLTNPNFPGDARRYHAIYPATVAIADVPTTFSQLISGADDFCTQLLGVTNPNDFDENDINFPNDVTVSCPVDPTNTGFPTVNEDACSNVAITQDPDLIVPLNNDTACYKILRNWIIIDWCQYDGNGAGYWEHEQVIKVNDQEAPTIDTGCEYESFDITTDNDGNFNNGCTGPVSLTATGSDNCSSDLNFSYIVRDATGSILPGLNGQGNGSTYNRTLSLGSYTIEWTLHDGCGNYVQCVKPFDVLDNTPPLVYADFGLEVNLTNLNATIWANDFDEGSSDECSGICDFRIATPSQGPGQTAPPTTTSVSFDCDDLGNNTVDFWVKDCANNWAYVSTFVIVQDNSGECSSPQSSNITGTISTELGDNVEDVTVDLTGNAGMNDSYVTSNDGEFGFLNLPNGDNYTTTPSNDLNHLNGVSTYDLVLISKHILSIESLDSPYKMIAADINKSGSITTFDMVELRKLILFINTEFPSNTSWRFVDASYVFPDVTNPFSTIFPEVNSINGLAADEIADFVGVKIGDVNGSAIPNNLVGGDDRNTVGDVVFTVADEAMVAGQEYTVDFTAKDFANVMGYQFTLAFDTDAVEFVDVNAGDLAGMNASNFGLSMINEGVITTSWNANTAAKLNNNDVVFSVTFKANTVAQLSDVMNISSRYTVAEAYNGELELMNVAVEYTKDGVVAAAGFDLFQNQPNPFKDVTTISFTLPEAATATLTVYDVSGRILRSVSGDYTKGYNEVTLNRSDLSGSGVLYYTLDTATDSATKKMIIVD